MPRPALAALAEGHYARKQLFCKDWLISWSHLSRFRLGLRLARQFAGQRLLDYGCGDGTFLAMLMQEPTAPRVAVGAELHASIVDDCRARFIDRPGMAFALVDDLDQPEHTGTYDAVFCMEVLEHVVDVEPVLARMERALAPSGKILISVPVEIGLPFAVKQTFRRIAGWRGLGDYPGLTPYTWRESWASFWAGRRQHLVRPVYWGDDGKCFHDHKGFNWRVLRDCLTQRFVLEQTFSSPLSWLPTQLASQVYLQLRKKAG